jgi:hypothetical protein
MSSSFLREAAVKQKRVVDEQIMFSIRVSSKRHFGATIPVFHNIRPIIGYVANHLWPYLTKEMKCYEDGNGT